MCNCNSCCCQQCVCCCIETSQYQVMLTEQGCGKSPICGTLTLVGNDFNRGVNGTLEIDSNCMDSTYAVCVKKIPRCNKGCGCYNMGKYQRNCMQ